MLAFLFSISHVFTCNHDYEMSKELRIAPPTPLRRPKAPASTKELQDEINAREPIRVFFNMDSIFNKYVDNEQCKNGSEINFYGYNCTQGDVLNDEKRNVINVTIYNAKNYIERLANVTRRKKPLNVNHICKSYNFNNTYKCPLEVDNVDLYIFVLVRPFGDTSSTLANAGSRNQEYDSDDRLNYGRPNIGQIRINGAKLPSVPQDENSGDRQFFVTCMHELMHVLAFSKGLFGDWINRSSGNNYDFKNNFYYTIENKYKLNQTFIATPRLTEWVNERFQVTDPVLRTLGLEIEDGGGGGTAGSHPNSRLYFTDIMQGRTYGPGYFSPIFFHALYDSGWYEPNYTMQEDLVYMDSRFFGDPPNQHVLSTPPRETFPKKMFCSNKYDFYCFYDYSAKGTCDFTTKKELVDGEEFKKNESESFDHSVLIDVLVSDWYGANDRYGTDDLLDYQPVILPTDSLCRDSNSLNIGNVADLAKKMKETYSATSVCAISTIFNGDFGEVPIGQLTGCYQARCGEDKKLRITLKDTDEQICMHEGQKIYMKGSMKHVLCPNPKAACATLPKTKMVTVLNSVPDRGPHNGKNFVMLEGFDLLKYNISKIYIGNIEIENIIERSNSSILIQMPNDISQKTKEQLTKPQNLKITCEGEGQPEETIVESFYTFLNRDYE